MSITAVKVFWDMGSIGIRLNGLILIAGEGVNSTIIQCVHEQSLTGICIFPVFYLFPMDHICTNR